MASSNPTAVAGGWQKDSPAVEEKNPIDTQSIPRTAAGVVSESGDILDKSGETVGKIADSDDPQELVGNTVTAGGDVVNRGGEVLSKATLSDATGAAEEAQDAGDYTTERAGEHAEGAEQEAKGGSGWFGRAGKGAYDAVSGVGGSVRSAFGSQAGKSEAGEPTPQADDITDQDKLKEQAPEAEETANINLEDKDSQDAVEGKGDELKEAGDDVKEKTDDVEVPDAGEQTDKVAEDGQEAVGDAKETTEDATGDAKDKAEDATGDVKENTEDATEDAKDAAEGTTEDAKETAEGTAEDAKDSVPEGEVPEGEGVTDDLKDKAAEGEEAAEGVKEDAEEQAPVDFSVLKGLKVNKGGNLVDDKGAIIGRIIEGDPKKLAGRTADEDGNIWNESGKVIGKAEPIPEKEREGKRDAAPFENFPDAVVEADGKVTSEGRQVGTVVDGDPKKLKGSKVDEDGDILDRSGNVVGKAEAWDEPEPIPEEVQDRSILAGKRVNKAGNVVDGSGVIFGRVVEGNVASFIGRMCDKDGNVRSESGDVIGRAEVVPEGEREGSKEGPFAELTGCTIAKDGKVVTPAGDVVGRLVSGDPKTLFGRSVDEDGDVVDRNGNVLAKAERWEEPEVEKKKDPLAGRRVNREGNVVDEDGNIIGKLTSGDLSICAGKEIDDDGDVLNSKGNTIGHVNLLADIPPEPEPEEPAETEEEKHKREQAEKDKELAGQLASAIEQSLEKIRPICKRITDKVDKAERTPKEELDEEQLVKEIKPLLEDGNKILTETNGIIRGMDPDGRIQRNAKHKSATRDASPEEYHLADVLKELTGTVTECIDNGKRKVEDMPHAKKELNPLWGLLAEPLFQILAAVGLLLNGVLGLVGRLLSGLGLGGLVDGLLGGLGLDKILGGLGLSDALGSLTGKKKK